MKRIPALPVASALFVASLAALVAAPSTGCAPHDDDTSSTEQASTAEDLAEARGIVALLGGENGRCKGCHGVTAAKIRAWGTALQNVEAACFAPQNLTAEQRVNCLRINPADPSSNFSPRKLGLYTTASGHQSFKDLFESTFPPDTWTAEYVAFAQRVGMPRRGRGLTPAEFAKLKAWVLRGMPQLDQVFAGGDAGAAPDASTPVTCTPSTTPELAAHLAAAL